MKPRATPQEYRNTFKEEEKKKSISTDPSRNKGTGANVTGGRRPASLPLKSPGSLRLFSPCHHAASACSRLPCITRYLVLVLPYLLGTNLSATTGHHFFLDNTKHPFLIFRYSTELDPSRASLPLFFSPALFQTPSAALQPYTIILPSFICLSSEFLDPTARPAQRHA